MNTPVKPYHNLIKIRSNYNHGQTAGEYSEITKRPSLIGTRISWSIAIGTLCWPVGPKPLLKLD